MNHNKKLCVKKKKNKTVNFCNFTVVQGEFESHEITELQAGIMVIGLVFTTLIMICEVKIIQ